MAGHVSEYGYLLDDHNDHFYNPPTVPFTCPGNAHFNLELQVCDSDHPRAACPLSN